MKIKIYKISLTIGLTILMLCLLFFSFVRYIVSCRDCERFNIDNIEIHAQSDIPALIHSSIYCKYIDSSNIKIASFLVDKVSIVNNENYGSMKKFVGSNKLRPMLDSSHKFYKIIANKSSTSKVTFDTILGRLDFNICFNN